MRCLFKNQSRVPLLPGGRGREDHFCASPNLVLLLPGGRGREDRYHHRQDDEVTHRRDLTNWLGKQLVSCGQRAQACGGGHLTLKGKGTDTSCVRTSHGAKGLMFDGFDRSHFCASVRLPTGLSRTAYLLVVARVNLAQGQTQLPLTRPKKRVVHEEPPTGLRDQTVRVWFSMALGCCQWCAS